MKIARRLDAQYQQYNKSVHIIFLEEIPILLPKLDQTTRGKGGILGFIFKVIIGIASEAVSPFIKYRQNKSLQKAIIAIRNSSE